MEGAARAVDRDAIHGSVPTRRGKSAPIAPPDAAPCVPRSVQAQRDIAERGATMEEVQKAINGRKPDFKQYVEPQKAKADIIIQVRMREESVPAPRLALPPSAPPTAPPAARPPRLMERRCSSRT